MTFVASCSVCNAFVVMTFVAPPFVIWRIPDEIRHSVTELISTTNVVDNIFKLVEYLHFILYWISENQKHFILLLWHFCTLREKFLLICSTIERQKRVENRFPLRHNINLGVLERDERDMVFSCPGSSIPDLGQWLTDSLTHSVPLLSLTATLEFRHKEWLSRLQTLQTFGLSEKLEEKSWQKGWKKFLKSENELKKIIFLAALAALYLTLVSHWLTDSLTATLEFRHKEWLLRLQTLQTFDRHDAQTKRP